MSPQAGDDDPDQQLPEPNGQQSNAAEGTGAAAPADAAEDVRQRKGSVVLNSQQQNKQRVKLEQGKYSYTKRKKPIIDGKSVIRQWAPVPEEA